jgi:hypothetical protein
MSRAKAHARTTSPSSHPSRSGTASDGPSVAPEATGTFYAVQALRQLLQPGGGLVQLNDVVVRDWPPCRSATLA